MYCKSAFSKGCAGVELDSFSFAGRVIEETEGWVCVFERERKYLREDERLTCIGGGSGDGYIQTGRPRMDWDRIAERQK